MKDMKVSSFTLERFRLGELSPEDNMTIRNALVSDNKMRSDLEQSLKQLDESDRELRLRYPYESLGLQKIRIFPTVIRFAAIAAGLILCILLPVLLYTQNSRLTRGTIIAEVQPNPQDRPKGSVLANAELSIYLKGDQQAPLPDQSILREGNTVQLAYTTPAGADFYGVIFSIDGRSQVTMHYPYRRGQSSLLVSGRKTFLNEAYTLDDAPGYELFVMVISDRPLDADVILSEAGKMAKPEPAVHELTVPGLKSLEEKSKEVFDKCEVTFAAIIKR